MARGRRRCFPCPRGPSRDRTGNPKAANVFVTPLALLVRPRRSLPPLEFCRGRHLQPGGEDWFSHRILAWRLSIGMETGLCVDALQEARRGIGG
ncbi:MAG: hypothetical protein QOF70_705 [Acetobacteraceae bacterium]|jgi:hypothetical protein|nr:hypothetical protein [Acetobacteraceae bacterium]